ncbi:serine/threonine-protein phosphatase [Rhizobium rhizogenes]|uniref:PP2C family protein-serine/threonine phosphatase n=1 Tax=Rhizobium rhizogenes TaxID=359 RepID=UPI00193E84F5|nr:PP2C family serine/threonine-protein phosphatase [Rhizobium rhizogenes]QRM39461.1 serine/threonine-protein phosphatase [Rhizobium rhizogenes]
MELKFSSFSCQGARPTNQDRLLEPVMMSAGTWIAAIADGVGGASGGAEAAQFAIETAAANSGLLPDLDLIFAETVKKIIAFAAADEGLKRMATTLSVIHIQQATVHVAHVGDTRIYHLRGGGLNTLTRDQTELAELRRKGILSEYQARRYPRKNVLLSALSPRADYEIYHSEAALESGDRLLLLTDGLYEKLTRQAISDLSSSNAEVERFANALRDRAADLSPTDNFTAVAVEVTY